jgi:uncharacterized Zn-binding protein involved in type VI secretion
MPTGPAARITDNVVHPLPPVLTPGPGSPNTLIGFLPAWRGIPAALAGAVQAAKQASDIAVQAAEAATAAAAGTPGAPAAYAAEQATKTAIASSMGSMISGMAAGCGADIHACVTPTPVPPHGPGVVIDGSPTVLINMLPACRLGDTIIEPLGPPNKIVKGEFTVIIGQSGSGSGGSASPGSPASADGSGQGVTGQAKIAEGGSGSTGPHPDAKAAPPGPGSVLNLQPRSPSMKALANAAQTGQPVIDCESKAPG